jgi:2,4-dienoyl-CoA reductase-like NADH-dependent reductase (Old Yellow Enzyme family)
MYLFKGDAPIDDFAAALPQPLRMGIKLVGKRFLREYPYRDAYLLEDARLVRAAVDLPLVLLGGVTNYAVMEQAMREGFQFVAMGRALLREPDLVNRIAADRTRQSLCTHCNRCMATVFSGTRCVLAPTRLDPGTAAIS